MRRLIIGALALTTIGLAACGEAVTDAAPKATTHETRPAPAEPTNEEDDDVRIQIMAMDAAWATNSDDVCGPYNEVRDAIDHDTLMDFLIDKYEEGYGETLEPEARDHLIGLIESC